MKCRFKHPELGRCQQPPAEGGLCWYHAQARPRHDPYYHRKVVQGLLEPTNGYLEQVEIDALFAGRKRNDGRRLDHYVQT
jgi:hypothetical protein